MQIVGLLSSMEEAQEIKNIANISVLADHIRRLARKSLLDQFQKS